MDKKELNETDTKSKKNETKENKVTKAKKSKKTKQRSRKRTRRGRRRNNQKKVIVISLVLMLILTIIAITSMLLYKRSEDQRLKKEENLKNDILSHYNEYVSIEDESYIYVLKDGKYIEFGKLNKGQEISLKNVNITHKDEYLEISSFEEPYYIHYKKVNKIDKLSESQTRHKKYIPFNSNIVTKDITNFYDEDHNLVYQFNKSFDFPIIVNKEDLYGVEYNDKLLYIDKEDVKEIVENKNTDKKNTSGIAILNYHFFEDSDQEGDSCNQVICLSTKNLKKHLEYIKSNDIFTPTMKELEMYIDGYIQLPKSVVLTIDDGWRAKIGSQVISDYGLNATIFLMSKYYDPKNYQNEYIEVHSHGYDIHNGGLCPGGQGGEIKCMERTKLLADLNASRDKLNNTTYFCYPFYEYNDYSISVLKEAGFTMAFGGPNEGGKSKVVPGINKFKLPRYIIYSYTTANNIANYIK